MKEQIINIYLREKSINRTAKALGLSTIRVTNVLRSNDLVKQNSKGGGRKSTYNVDTSFFKIIDTENKAYVLGFIYADGNVSKSKNSVTLNLKRSDREVLEKVKSCMGSNHKLIETTGRYSKNHPVTEKIVFTVCNSEIHEDLIALGCFPNKGDILKFPTVRKDLIRHFMRGYFDGDGTVFIENQYGKIRFGITSTFDFCKSYLKELKSSETTVHKEKRSSKNVYYFTISKEPEILRIYHFLYKDATIFLERKKEKFDSYFKEKI